MSNSFNDKLDEILELHRRKSTGLYRGITSAEAKQAIRELVSGEIVGEDVMIHPHWRPSNYVYQEAKAVNDKLAKQRNKILKGDK